MQAHRHFGSASALPACLLAASLALGCSGLSLGDSGTEAIGPCAASRHEPVRDPSARPPELDVTPETLLAPLAEELVGTLTLSDGRKVPLRVTMAARLQTLEVVYSDDTEHDCDPWLEATVDVSIDADEVLRGEVDAKLSTRELLQLRGGWDALSQFEATPEPPDFGNARASDRSIIVSLLRESENEWSAGFQFAANVPRAPCNANQMCSGAALGTPSPEYRLLGDGVLRPVARSDDAGL